MSILLYPPYLQWEIASACNHRCVHCYNYWRTGSVSVDDCTKFNEITEKIIERKPLYLAITGGEPLLFFNKIKSCIEKMCNAGIIVSISTNATLITDEIIDFVAANRIDLVISLPSISEQVCVRICNAQNVVQRLSEIIPQLKSRDIGGVINVVLTKLNIDSLYETLKAIKKFGYPARVGIAQRPINASAEYIQYELDKDDFNFVVKQCIKAKKELDLELDFSVCIPDCAFDDPDDLAEIEKGNCFAGTIAYAISTNGDIKACQCDTKTYGNILVDSFEEVYKRMAEWRNGSMIPSECSNCNHLYLCRGGCRVETYAKSNDYKGLPAFANPKNTPIRDKTKVEIEKFSTKTKFALNEDVVFLRDKECYRVSIGIVAVHLAFEFADWLQHNKEFLFSDLIKASKIGKQQLNLILNMLYKNRIIRIQ